ncbi:MAG: hypothetical protein IPL63_11305 [Saprospiraceae bacterium]|nr:hypothetical protein [Saprospiraceae bacterium]
MSLQNITYILGAGASCTSLPLVSDMKIRMEIFVDFLSETLNTKNKCSEVFTKNRDKLIKIRNQYKEILDSIKNHYTPDTYAKKLSLTGQFEDIKKLKEFLNLYLLFEQHELLPADKSIFRNRIQSLVEFSQKVAGSKTNYSLVLGEKMISNIDYRYDVFLSSLLLKTKLKMFSNYHSIIE